MAGNGELKKKTAKGLLWGGIGNGMMQILNLLFGIFLARMLTPADYGMVGALTIFSTLAGLLAESGFILAIVNKKEATAKDYNALFWFSTSVSAVIYIILFFAAPLIASFYHEPEMKMLSRVLFIGFLFGGLSAAPTAYLFRNLMVKQRSLAMITAICISGVIGVTCAANGCRYWGIAVQSVSYIFINCMLVWWWCPWRPSFVIDFKPLLEMLPFSIKQLIITLFTQINNNIFSVLLGRFYNMQITGYYTQGSKWTMMGYGIIQGMINGVGQPVLREAATDAVRRANVFSKMLRFTAFISFPALFGLAIVARELIIIAVTDKWIDSVPVIQILCAGSAFIPICLLYANLFNSMGRPSVYMWNTIALGLTQIVSIAVTYRMGLNVMLAFYSLINILWVFVWQYFAGRYAGIRWKTVVRDISSYLVVSLFVMGVTLWGTRHIENTLLSLTVKIVMAAGLYCFILWRANSVIFKESVDYLLKRKR